MEGLPTGVVAHPSKGHTPYCADGCVCYATPCSKWGQPASFSRPPAFETPAPRASIEWQEVLASLPKSEVDRQTIIRKVISREEQYIKDLDFVEEVFIRPLWNANPPVIQNGVGEFIEEVFGNILDLRECNRHLLETMYVRQQEQGEIISRIGDIFLHAATEFRLVYPTYIGQMSVAEKRLKEEMQNNSALRVFLVRCFRHPDNVSKMDLKHWLNRPSEHLQKYPVLIEAIRTETAEGNPDVDYLKEAVEVMGNIQSIAQRTTLQVTTGKEPTGKFQRHNLVPEDTRNRTDIQEAKRQA